MGMRHHDGPYTIEELAALTGLSVRTVRYYIAENLLPGPGSRGKGAIYTEEHLLRLRLIRLLTERRTPLAEIGEMMGRLGEDEISGLLAEEESYTQTRAERADSPRAYISTLLEQARGLREQKRTFEPARFRAYPGHVEPNALRSGSPVSHSSVWRRVQIAPGVELHIEERLESQNRALIDRLLAVDPEEAERD